MDRGPITHPVSLLPGAQRRPDRAIATDSDGNLDVFRLGPKVVRRQVARQAVDVAQVPAQLPITDRPQWTKSAGAGSGGGPARP